MRTVERWQEVLLPKVLKKLPDRIQEDIQTIPFPEEISKIDKVKSSFIYGNSEHGKTITSIFLLLQEEKNLYMNLNTDRKDCLFVSTNKLFYDIKKTFKKDYVGEDECEVIDRYKDCHFLVLDDLGVKKTSDWFLDILYLIINERYEHMLKTVITSNFTLTELSEQFGDNRITSRIQRMCEVIEKKDWRK